MIDTNCYIEQKLPASTTQVVIVRAETEFKATITTCEKQGSDWKMVLSKPFPGVVGKSGVAEQGQKKEGDLKTPSGLFPIGDAFGQQPMILKMGYRLVSKDDKFIDDVRHKDYNTWVKGDTDAKSFENMLHPLYKMGLIVNYNMHPVVPGAGSAIFIHLWPSPDLPTNGCIAMDAKHLNKILHWLDKRKHPYVFIANQSSKVKA